MHDDIFIHSITRLINPDAPAQFCVTLSSGEQVMMSARTLLSYKTFQAKILEETGWVYKDFSCPPGRGWDRTVQQCMEQGNNTEDRAA